MTRGGRVRKRGSLTRLIFGWILTVGGIILALPLVPGPGILVFFAGIALLSTESRFIRNLIRRHRETRLIKRALREAERVGLKINLDADPEESDEPGGARDGEEIDPPGRATGSQG